MSIKVHQLPELIAAAVQKAIDDKQITDATLESLLKLPITIGLVASTQEKEPVSEPSVGWPFPPIRLGYLLNKLEDISDPANLKDPAK